MTTQMTAKETPQMTENMAAKNACSRMAAIRETWDRDEARLQVAIDDRDTTSERLLLDLIEMHKRNVEDAHSEYLRALAQSDRTTALWRQGRVLADELESLVERMIEDRDDDDMTPGWLEVDSLLCDERDAGAITEDERQRFNLMMTNIRTAIATLNDNETVFTIYADSIARDMQPDA